MNPINIFRERWLRNDLTQELIKKDASASRIVNALKNSTLTNKVAIFANAYQAAMMQAPPEQWFQIRQIKKLVDSTLEKVVLAKTDAIEEQQFASSGETSTERKRSESEQMSSAKEKKAKAYTSDVYTFETLDVTQTEKKDIGETITETWDVDEPKENEEDLTKALEKEILSSTLTFESLSKIFQSSHLENKANILLNVFRSALISGQELSLDQRTNLAYLANMENLNRLLDYNNLSNSDQMLFHQVVIFARQII